MTPEYQQYYAEHRLWIMLHKFVLSRYLAYKADLNHRGDGTLSRVRTSINSQAPPQQYLSSFLGVHWLCGAKWLHCVEHSFSVYQLLRYLSTWEASILLKLCGKGP
jgi:hypothetical protein